ncbi:MAG: ATP-binding protein [Bacteroidota bacterium]
MDTTKLLGTIYAVSASSMSVVLHGDLSIVPTGDSTQYRPGQIGTYVVVPLGDREIIGAITSIRDDSLLGGEAGLTGHRIIEVSPVGTLQGNRFERGVTTLPLVGDTVYATNAEDLKLIFATYRDFDFSVGKISMFDTERFYIDPNKFFGKHIAIFGSSGSGKSFTVAAILQKVANFQNTHVILLDLHGEYESAFKDTADIIKITELELPYWLMNFDELIETFIDENEPSANNQMMVMKDAVIDSKRGKNLLLKEFITVDTPLYFDFLDVTSRMKALDTERTLGGKEGPFYGQFTRFLVRMDSKIYDKRYEFLFRPKKYRSSDTFAPLLSRLFNLDTEKTISIIDLSGVPFDVVNTLVSLLGRIIYDFNLWNVNRRDFPVLIAFEEAHNYLSPNTKSKAALKTVERIAKEGRKYGVSCMIVSQRPAEISETITAQCNNFVAMRLLNPNDQSYVRKLVPESQSNFIDVLPTLRQGEVYIIGDAAPIPVRVIMDKASPEPAGSDIMFFDKWKQPETTVSVTEVVDRWWKQLRR